MPHRPVRVPAPRDNDCFFHVVAYFHGSDIKDWGAAKRVRRTIAERLAQTLLPPPWNDLDVLTAAKLYGLGPSGAAPPALRGDLDALGHQLLQAHNQAQARNTVPEDIIDYLVWVQFSFKEVDDFYRLYHAAPRFKYTIWGDECLAALCVERFLNRPVALYSEVDAVTFLQSPVLTGAEYNRGHAVVNLLSVDDVHFDAVLFYDVEQQDRALASFQQMQAHADESSEQKAPRVLPCEQKLVKVVVLIGDDDSGNTTLRKAVNLPRDARWRDQAGVPTLDHLAAQTRLKLFFDGESGHDREIRVELLIEEMPYVDDRGAAPRRPSPAEHGRKGRYGWSLVHEAHLGTESAEGQLSEQAAKSRTARWNQPLFVTVSGAKEVVVPGLFLPACGGLRYRFKVTDNQGNQVESSNAVETYRRLYYHPLLAKSLEAQRGDVERALKFLRDTYAPLYLDLRPTGPMVPFDASTVSTTEGERGRYDEKLMQVSRQAAAFHPYFFNIAAVSGFANVKRETIERAIFIGALRQNPTIEVTTLPISTTSAEPLRRATLLYGNERYSVRSSCELRESSVLITVPNEIVLALCKAAEARGLTDVERAIERQERQRDKEIFSDPAYQQEARQIEEGYKDPVECRNKLAELLATRRREWSYGQRRQRIVTEDFEVILVLEELALQQPSQTAGFRHEASKSCTLPFDVSRFDGFCHTLVHEVGHAVGLAPGRGAQGLDASPTYYEDRGHQGPHCHFGVALLDDYNSSGVSGQCIMFGSDSRLPGHNLFCPVCAGAVLRSDYSAGFLARDFKDLERKDILAQEEKTSLAGDVSAKAGDYAKTWRDLYRSWESAQAVKKQDEEKARREQEQDKEATAEKEYKDLLRKQKAQPLSPGESTRLGELREMMRGNWWFDDNEDYSDLDE